MAKVHITHTSPKDDQEDEHVVLFTCYDNREIAQLGIGACNCAVLDGACSSTVCGETWLENYLLDEPFRPEENGADCWPEYV